MPAPAPVLPPSGPPRTPTRGALPPVSPVSSQPNNVAAPAPSPPEPTIRYSWREMHPDATLFYIRDHTEANRALEQLDNTVYGLDCEWRPNYVKGETENPVALVQIANDKVILLLQLSAMQEFPSRLRQFLLNPAIIKAGVGIQNDARKLYQDWNADVRSFVDLSLLARTVDNSKWKGKYNSSLGLARLVATYEGRALGKGKITRSNWERSLNEAQQIYAANDAHAGYTVYMRMMTMIPSVSPKPHVKYYTFDSTRGRLCDPSGATWDPFNPNYDPGPPPPPREPKPQKNKQPRAPGTINQIMTPAAFPFRPPGLPSLPNSADIRGGRGPREEVPSRAALPAQDASTYHSSANNQTRGRGGLARGRGSQRGRLRGFPRYNESRRSHPDQRGDERMPSTIPSQSSEYFQPNSS